jgi:HEAT repeat protein
MDKAVTDNRPGLSLHSLKAALAHFPLSQALQLLPAMRHTNPRVRLAAAEVLREMAKHEAAEAPVLFDYKEVFDRELARLTSDVYPEVRAVAGEVTAHLDFAAPGSVVSHGLQDPQSSVRMGALQALAQRPRLLPVAEIQRFLTDPQRAVRQAAIRALLSYGREGVAKLYEQFLKTEDKTLRDQFIEDLAHAGLLLDLLQNFGDSSANLETRVVQRLVSVGATRYLRAALTNSSGRQLLQSLFEKLEDHSPPKIDAWLGLCAALKADRRLEPNAHRHSDWAI